MKPVLLSVVATIVVLVAMLNCAVAQPATNGLILWLDASDASTIKADGSGHISAWLNKAPGSTNAVGFSGNNDNSTSPAYNSAAPTYMAGPHGIRVVHFDGNGYLDNTNFSAVTPSSLTVFLLGAANANAGNYSAFMALRQSSSVNDYQTGLNFDQGLNSSLSMSLLNIEGTKAGGGGGFNLINGSRPFGSFNLFEIDYGGGAASNNSNIKFVLDGTPQLSLNGTSNPVNLRQIYVGTRAYVSGGVPTANHDLQGQIAALLLYDHQVTPSELAQTEGYLLTYLTNLTPTLNIPSVNSSEIQIVGFSNGQLAWSNSLPGTTCAVQWATSLASADFTNVPALEKILVTNPFMTASVPLAADAVKFLRISQQMKLSLDLVAYYTFEGNGNDLSGNTNNATVTNNVTFAPGISGLAASFDGSTSYIQVNESPSLELAGPMTITAWVNPSAEGALNCIVDKDAQFLGYNLYLENGGVQMRVSSTRGTAAVTGGSVPLNTWSHVAGVFTGSQILVYQNGSLVGQVPAPSGLSNISKNLYIGMWGAPGSGRFFQGQIDNVRIYNRPLYHAEVQALATLHQ